MALTFKLNKYTKDSLTLLSSTEITEFIEQDFSIVKQLEFDTIWNFSVSYVELEFLDNSPFLMEFRNSSQYQLKWWDGQRNLREFLYGIEILRDGYNIFVGQLLPDSVEHNEEKQTFIITARDWYKYFYEKLESRNPIRQNLFTNLDDFLSLCFPIYNFPEVGILSGRNINVNNQSGSWSSIPNFILSSGLLTYQHLLNEVQKHYGAFLFVDKNYKLNFINRSKYTNSTPLVIDNYILESDYTEIPFTFNEYDAVLINQATPMGTSTEISWRLFYWEDGLLKELQIFSEQALDSLPKNLKIIDLRQELFLQGDGVTVPFSFYKGFGYRIFPQRTRDEIYSDYKHLIDIPNKINCRIVLPENMSVDILNKIYIDNSVSFGEFITYAIEEFPSSNEYKLTLLRNSLRGTILP